MKEVSSTRRPSRLEISGSQVVYRLNSVKQWRYIQSATPQWMYLSTCWSESSSSSYNATDVTHRIRLKFSSLVRLLRNKTFNKTHSHRQSSCYSDYDIDTNQQSRTMELKLTMKNRQKEQKEQKKRWSIPLMTVFRDDGLIFELITFTLINAEAYSLWLSDMKVMKLYNC